MRQYLDIVDKILKKGVKKGDRTGTGTVAIAGAMFEHDMSEGFPLLTTKRIGFKTIASELEFFIRGKTDKKWLQERKNHIWDEWCNPEKVPYSHDEDAKRKMAEERDLGPIYGFQWRHFNAKYLGIEGSTFIGNGEGFAIDYSGRGVDQLKNLVDTLKKNPNDRRMLVSAWNPQQISEMALPACHYGFQVTVLNNKLNLMWNQRSVDTMLGLPYNIASYGLLLHLLAKESGFEEGKLIGFLGDVHIYNNHINGAREQLSRKPKRLPKIETPIFSSIFDWKYQDSKISDYEPYDKINFDISV